MFRSQLFQLVLDVLQEAQRAKPARLQSSYLLLSLSLFFARCQVALCPCVTDPADSLWVTASSVALLYSLSTGSWQQHHNTHAFCGLRYIFISHFQSSVLKVVRRDRWSNHRAPPPFVPSSRPPLGMAVFNCRPGMGWRRGMNSAPFPPKFQGFRGWAKGFDMKNSSLHIAPYLHPVCSRFAPYAQPGCNPRRCWVPWFCSRRPYGFPDQQGGHADVCTSQAARLGMGITSAPLRSLSKWSAHAFIMVRRSVKYVAWL